MWHRKQVFLVMIMIITLFVTPCSAQNNQQQVQDDVASALEAFKNGDYATAFPKLLAAARKGDASAQFWLGMMYFNGTGVEKNLPASTEWFRRASDQGVDQAGLMYGLCLNAAGRFAESNKYLRISADKGDATAQYMLALQYISGHELPQDCHEVITLLKKSADQDYAGAQSKLGQLAALGMCMPKDGKLAERYLRPAANSGDALAQVFLGTMLYSGDGITANPTEAVQWWLKAVASGDSTASMSLGVAYLEGKGVAKNDAEATRWFRSGAEAGDAGSQYRLGQCYYHGLGVAKDLVQSLAWLRIAEAHNYSGSHEDAQAVAAEMSAADIKAAEAAANAWITKHPD